MAGTTPFGYNDHMCNHKGELVVCGLNGVALLILPPPCSAHRLPARVPADAPEGAGVPGSWALRNWGALKPGDKWPFEAVKATPALDMWAFGIVVYEVRVRRKSGQE